MYWGHISSRRSFAKHKYLLKKVGDFDQNVYENKKDYSPSSTCKTPTQIKQNEI